MQNGTYDIAFTLGRLQPPHYAHVHMLVGALFSLKENGKLIQFIGSTNMPLSVTKNEKNILSFEEREAMLTTSLVEELVRRHQQDAHSIPPKFAQRIEQGRPLLSPDDFVCIPLPDFSDPHRIIVESIEFNRAAAMDEVQRAGLPQDERFSACLREQIEHYPLMKSVSVPVYSTPYIAWALNLRKILNNLIETYREQHHVLRPSVVYHCCGKDMGTLQYILLIATMIEFFKHDYDFTLGFMPVQMLNDTLSVNATDIRDAFVDLLTEHSDEQIRYFMSHPDALPQKFPILQHMSASARVAMLNAMMKLSKKI